MPAILLQLFLPVIICAQYKAEKKAGTFSLGTRNTVSLFNDDPATGKGIGGQMRLRLSNKLNTEWFLDYITSKNSTYTSRNDYHIGWSLMFYPGEEGGDNHILQPYFIAGHCFDKTVVTDQKNSSNTASRLSMATQAGMGTHINITPRFDCSLSGQYMLHFGKEIQTRIENEEVVITKANHSNPDGHLLFTLSFNYKLLHCW